MADDNNPLVAELEALRAELEQLRGDSLRERADLDNQRKRMARELEGARRFANERLLADLLPLFDSMEAGRSEEHTSELQSLMRISYAVFCLQKKNHSNTPSNASHTQAQPPTNTRH